MLLNHLPAVTLPWAQPWAGFLDRGGAKVAGRGLKRILVPLFVVRANVFPLGSWGKEAD